YHGKDWYQSDSMDRLTFVVRLEITVRQLHEVKNPRGDNCHHQDQVRHHSHKSPSNSPGTWGVAGFRQAIPMAQHKKPISKNKPSSGSIPMATVGSKNIVVSLFLKYMS
ncbi:MAG: hypothetical protein ACRCU5_15715, partial [Rhizobiaceae bacterium]